MKAGTMTKAKTDVYQDESGEWRWRVIAANGNVIADSGEGYTQKHNAVSGLAAFLAAEQ